MRIARFATFAISMVVATSCGFFKKLGKGDSRTSTDNPIPAEHEPIDADPKLESPVNLVGDLRTFASCAEAETYVADKTIASLKHDLDQQIKWFREQNSYKRAGDYSTIESSAPQADNAATRSEAAPAAASGAAGAAAPTSHTGTNNQVAGVEESDFVQNNGTHIFQINGSKIRIMKSWPAESMELIASKEFTSRPFQLLLNGNQLIVLSHPVAKDDGEIYNYYRGMGSAVGQMQAPNVNDGSVVGPMAPVKYVSFNQSAVEITVLDVTNPAAPAEKSRYLLDGNFKAARGIGNTVRIILGSYPHFPNSFSYSISPYDQQFSGVDKEEVVKKMEASFAEAASKIRGIKLADWLRMDQFGKLDDKDAVSPVSDLKECTNIHAPTVSTRLGLTRVATVDLDKETITETILMADSDKVYASQDALYLTAQYYWWDETSKDTDWSFVHKFSLKDPSYAPYEGSGGFPGSVLNQFSIDEFEGNLRVATTISSRTPQIGAATNPEGVVVWRQWDISNKVFVLAPEGGILKIIGETEPVGKGERIYGTRFYGKRGFVVTYKQTDPLFTVDLSDPRAPKIVGELKIPGYSSYLQMIDEDHLLAIGRDGTASGQTLGPKISIFDVSDMTSPKETHKISLSQSFWTEAEYDHHAITYYPEKKMLGIPATGYFREYAGANWWGGYKSALFVFKIDVAAGISLAGEVDMTDIYTSNQREYGWWSSAAKISRSIFADDYVYAISDLGVRSAKTSALGTNISSVQFDCDETCYNTWGQWYY
jgi:uncharacterized secreted protein with C-terminal beta-propeller domain